MEIRILKKEEISRIDSLVSTYEFHDFRTYRMLGKNILKEYLINQIFNLSKENNNWVLAAEDKKKIVGLAVLTFLPWDSKLFKIRMCRISHLMSIGNYKAAGKIKNRLLTSILDICRKEHFAHLSCRIDIEDISSLHSLEGLGFKAMDTKVTFLFNRQRHKIPQIRTIYQVRKYKKKDLPHLVRIAKSSFSKDRFHLDPFISQEKADSLYSEWVKNSAMTRSPLFVAVNKSDKPVGFLTYKLLARISNYKIVGKDALMAVIPSAKGAIIGLMKAMLEDIVLNYDSAEFCTHLSNREAIRLFRKFNLDLIRTGHTFHKWV